MKTVDGVNGTGSADYAVRFTNSQSAIDQTVYQFEFQQSCGVKYYLYWVYQWK